jgi:hypothetical protein
LITAVLLIGHVVQRRRVAGASPIGQALPDARWMASPFGASGLRPWGWRGGGEDLSVRAHSPSGSGAAAPYGALRAIDATARWTRRAGRRMLPGPDGGGAQMRYRVAPSSWSKCRPWPIVPMASSGRPGLPRSAPPMPWMPRPARSPVGSRPTGWTCWTKPGKKHSSSRSTLALLH